MGAGRDLYCLRKDGREVPVEIGLSPIGTGDDQLVLVSIIDLTERSEAAERLEASLREKDVLLREIHHRVKNNLTVISSLLYLTASASDDVETRRILDDCRDRVRSMALVHERIYLSPDLSRVDFSVYCAELVRELVRNRATSPIELELELDALQLDIDEAIPCGLIVTELVSNALQHAFPDRGRGRLAVRLRQEGSRVELSVVDDGVGHLHGTTGDDRSLGLRLVRSLAAQIGAEIEMLDRSPGTEARLTLEQHHARDT